MPDTPTTPRSRRDAWTPELRQVERDRIYRTRPWEKSTGPRTPEGKAIVAGNALKHGLYSAATLLAQSRLLEMLSEANDERQSSGV